MYHSHPNKMSEKQPVTGYAPMPNPGPLPQGPVQMQPAYPPPQAGYPAPPIGSQPSFQSSQTTTVVVNQPAPLVLQQGQRDWSSGLCACFDDCYSCKYKHS